MVYQVSGERGSRLLDLANVSNNILIVFTVHRFTGLITSYIYLLLLLLLHNLYICVHLLVLHLLHNYYSYFVFECHAFEKKVPAFCNNGIVFHCNKWITFHFSCNSHNKLSFLYPMKIAYFQ